MTTVAQKIEVRNSFIDATASRSMEEFMPNGVVCPDLSGKTALVAELGADNLHTEIAGLTDIEALRGEIGRIKDRCGPAQVPVNNAAHHERQRRWMTPRNIGTGGSRSI